MFINTRGLVLREVKFKEADKFLTVLTENAGKLTVHARGACRKGSRIGAASQFLTWSEMTLFENKGAYSLNEAETLEQFTGLRKDIALLAQGSYFAELLEAVSDQDSPDPAVLSIGLNSLFALANNLYAPEHIKAVFEMRLMCLAGFLPMLDGCAVCGSVDFSGMLFGLNTGSLRCRGCPAQGPGVSLPVCYDTVMAMRHISSAESKRIFSFELGDEARKRLYDICEAYVPAQLERGFGALDYWKTVR